MLDWMIFSIVYNSNSMDKTNFKKQFQYGITCFLYISCYLRVELGENNFFQCFSLKIPNPRLGFELGSQLCGLIQLLKPARAFGIRRWSYHIWWKHIYWTCRFVDKYVLISHTPIQFFRTLNLIEYFTYHF